LGGTNHGIPVRLGLSDGRVPFDLGDAGFTERVQIALGVANVANGKTDDAQAHVGHVAGGDFLDFGRKGVAVLVNVLHGHGAKNGAQMAFQRLSGDAFDFVDALAQNLFRRGGNGNIVALDFDLRHAIDFDGHAFARINLRRLDIDGEQFQRENIDLLEHGHDKRAAALDDAKSTAQHRAVGLDELVLAPGNDQHLVWADLGVTAGPNGHVKK
jgi:hypothetical protein